MRECFCFGSEAVNASGEAARGLVKSRVEFPPASKGDFCLRMREKVFYFYPFVNALREARFSVLLNLTTEPLKENHCLIGPQEVI